MLHCAAGKALNCQQLAANVNECTVFHAGFGGCTGAAAGAGAGTVAVAESAEEGPTVAFTCSSILGFMKQFAALCICDAAQDCKVAHRSSEKEQKM